MLMMGIKEDSDMDSEPNTATEKKKYIVVKNHVREIPINKADETPNEISTSIQENVKIKKKKCKKVRLSSESDNSVNEISENDLNELRNVYNKCKEVMRRMESKYGHLLQIDEQSSSRSKHRLSSFECNCSSKRKIVYDDDGKQVYQNVDEEHHICLTNIKKQNKQSQYSPEPCNVTIEDETCYELPDTINELVEMLQEQKLSNYLKHQIMQKIRSLRQEHINTLRYEKPNLIDKLKSNSCDIFEFKGSNLSSLSGYPVEKL